jgi:hypothetical protein
VFSVIAMTYEMINTISGCIELYHGQINSKDVHFVLLLGEAVIVCPQNQYTSKCTRERSMATYPCSPVLHYPQSRIQLS